jgi:hypothetical protein
MIPRLFGLLRVFDRTGIGRYTSRGPRRNVKESPRVGASGKRRPPVAGYSTRRGHRRATAAPGTPRMLPVTFVATPNCRGCVRRGSQDDGCSAHLSPRVRRRRASAPAGFAMLSDRSATPAAFRRRRTVPGLRGRFAQSTPARTVFKEGRFPGLVVMESSPSFPHRDFGPVSPNASFVRVARHLPGTCHRTTLLHRYNARP